MRRSAAVGSLLLAAGVALAACSSGSGSPSTKASASASATSSSDKPVTKDTGIKVTGAYGKAPTITIPKTSAPKQLTEQTLRQGDGPVIGSGDVLIVNYVGETWAKKPKVFDSSFTRGAPAGFVIGKGQVITGWDKTLVGKKVGSRMVLTIPPKDGYGSTGNSTAGISGTDTLVFVVDLVDDYKPNASAAGTVDSELPATGWPKITNEPGKEPAITSVSGVPTPTKTVSKLLVQGSGAKIDSNKTLVLQLVQTDLATGKQTQTTWGQQPQLVSASNVLTVASALKDQNVGARAVVLLPATPAVKATETTPAQAASPAEVLIIDVVGQY